MVKKTEKKQLKGSHQAEPDAVKFERMEDWFQGFTVDQYVHLKDSGMKDSDLVDLLDIPVAILRHWKMLHGLASYPASIFEVTTKEQGKYYYKALKQRDLRHLLRQAGIQARSITEIPGDEWESFYVSLDGADSYTTQGLLEQEVVLGLLAHLEPVLETQAAEVCVPVGTYKVIRYGGNNGGQIVNFVQPHRAQKVKKGKPVQLLVKGRVQTAIKPGMYVVKNSLKEVMCYTSKEFFMLFDLLQDTKYRPNG
ncbi:TPA_asm: hypothetical protein GHM46_14850 [Listeria monocytogenes]|uniref:Uncharacterized protein n=2 Tax=Listeria monocytogenes TaxID=1639 RepID=A0A823FVM8_LISMN|nr:hypothetical protein [Listeria monocytogenes]EAE3706821.1 hypothetical protein [Listeria monocytogenes serotype 1/2b]EAD3773145.1 hypothetical protein [Listeria monocytogenes]EAD3785228.1 hypothetical protein [Listeria monocytogenes]EAD5628377.1 hypothetical protein [Listeria monocytogenes]EAE2382677.1 hypothetical protein [Listeria monocytogenes]